MEASQVCQTPQFMYSGVKWLIQDQSLESRSWFPAQGSFHRWESVLVSYGRERTNVKSSWQPPLHSCPKLRPKFQTPRISQCVYSLKETLARVFEPWSYIQKQNHMYLLTLFNFSSPLIQEATRSFCFCWGSLKHWPLLWKINIFPSNQLAMN